MHFAHASRPSCGSDIVIRPQSVEGTPLALGRAACSGLTGGGFFDLFSFLNMNRRREILVKRASCLCRSAPFAEIQHLQHTDAIERDGEDIANTHALARCIDARAIDAHLAGIGKRRRGAARAHDSCVP